MQHGDFFKGAEAEVDGPQNGIAKLLGQGRVGFGEVVGARSGQSQPAQGQINRKTPLVGDDPHLGGFEPSSKGTDVDFVLKARGGGQDDVLDVAVLGNEFLHEGEAFLGGGDGGVDEETARSQFYHGHADGGDDVEDPLELIEGPNLTGDNFLAEGLALAEGVDGE